jgi:serine/threonine protein kinase
MGAFSGIRQFLGALKGGKRVDLQKRFELTSTAGQGTMSKVYWARDREQGRMVCVKILDKEITARFEARFKGLNRPTEGAISQALEHPNLVKTYEHGLTTTGQQFIVMEMIEGRRLDVLIETRNPQLAGNQLKHLVQIADGLEYIHMHKFVHRDICPRNVIIDHRGMARIIDFGLSVPLRPEFCLPGHRTGAPDDIPPDLLKPVTPFMDPVLFKRGIMDNRIDLYALAVTAYEMLTRQLPWDRTPTVPTPGTRPRDPRKLVRNLDEETAQFLVRGVDPDPAERFGSATEMKHALKMLPSD